MKLEELIRRTRQSINDKIARHNAITEELEGLRAAETPDQERIAALLTERQNLAAEREALARQLEAYEVELRDDQAVQRLQSTITPTSTPASPAARAEVRSEANPVYRKGDASTSYFRDLWDAGRGERAAQDRLVASQERAMSSTAGAGGEFAPPLWLVEDFVALARAGRVTADLVNQMPLPQGVSSVSIPKVASGTAVAVTQTQNTTITDVSMTTTSVSSGIAEITGKQVVSIALLKQSGTPLDDIILGDLAAAYAQALDVQVISGSGANGQLRGLITAGTTIAFTTTQPAFVSTTVANSFYSKVLGAKSGVSKGRLLPPDTIVMTPARYDWALAAVDSTGRPLIVPEGPGQNQPATTGAPAAEGFVGRGWGLPIYVDPNIPENIGVATNQDVVFVLRASDLWLWESETETASFDATLAAQNSVLFRVLGFAAFIPDRHPKSVHLISGTGLVAPTF